jgi:hypothetical protein
MQHNPDRGIRLKTVQELLSQVIWAYAADDTGAWKLTPRSIDDLWPFG